MIGILCATPEELAALKAQCQLDPGVRRFGPTEVWSGTCHGHKVTLALAGMGKINAAAATTLLLQVFQPRALVFAGVAGGLSPAMKVGDILLGTGFAIHDYGILADGIFTRTPSGGFPIGVPALNALTPLAPQIAGHLAKLQANLHSGDGPAVLLGGLLTGDYFLACRETRDDLHATFGADAVDMESGAVHQVAEAWNCPLYVIRTLSDLAGEDSHIGYEAMAAMAATNSARCVPALLDLIAAET